MKDEYKEDPIQINAFFKKASKNHFVFGPSGTGRSIFKIDVKELSKTELLKYKEAVKDIASDKFLLEIEEEIKLKVE